MRPPDSCSQEPRTVLAAARTSSAASYPGLGQPAPSSRRHGRASPRGSRAQALRPGDAARVVLTGCTFETNAGDDLSVTGNVARRTDGALDERPASDFGEFSFRSRFAPELKYEEPSQRSGYLPSATPQSAS